MIYTHPAKKYNLTFSWTIFKTWNVKCRIIPICNHWELKHYIVLNNERQLGMQKYWKNIGASNNKTITICRKDSKISVYPRRFLFIIYLVYCCDFSVNHCEEAERERTNKITERKVKRNEAKGKITWQSGEELQQRKEQSILRQTQNMFMLKNGGDKNMTA